MLLLLKRWLIGKRPEEQILGRQIDIARPCQGSDARFEAALTGDTELRVCAVVPPEVPFSTVPPKIRDLESRLRGAGFIRQAAKGSHRKWTHPSGKFLVISGREGDDAKKYQEEQVQSAIAWVQGRREP